LERELDNIGAALRWAVEIQDADTAVRLCAMWHAPIIQADVAFSATLRWAADTVVAMPGVSEHPQYPAALVVAAAFAWSLSDQGLAMRRCDEAHAAEQRLGTEPSIMLWLVRSNVALAQGNPGEAIEHARQGIALSRARYDPAYLAWGLALSALSHALRGDTATAVSDAEEVVKLMHRLPNPHIVENALALAAFALGDSDPQRALALAREAVELERPGEHRLSWAIAGDLAARQGDHHAALTYFGRGIENAHWLGNRPGLGTMIGRVGNLLADSDPEATAVLQGAGAALAPGYAHARHTLEAHERAIASLEVSLGAARREELYQRGLTMTDDEAVTYAQAAINRRLSARA